MLESATRLEAALLVAGVLLIIGSAGCDPDGGTARGDGGAGRVQDTDGDTISDLDEGFGDTDGDGTPDFRDEDSDGDGLLDRDEAGDGNLSTPPRDSDADGTPDFRDRDSDGNGIFDGSETPGDVDGDGIPNFADLDDDGDSLSDVDEIGGDLLALRDSDSDGRPNFQDEDSDNDFIPDLVEGGGDTDADGDPDSSDTDADDDGILDRIEAGDMDVMTPPIDSDEDRIPDYLDPDSDNDGLPDRTENLAGTNPRLEDTDGDDVSDLIEVAAGTDATDGTVNPRTRGDFVFLIPHEEPPSPTIETLRFATSIQFADVYFLFDRSGSMDLELAALRSAVTGIIDNLTCEDFGTACERTSDCGDQQVCSLDGTCIADPFATDCVASPWTGAGWYLANLENTQRLQSNPARTRDPGLAFMVDPVIGTENLYRAALQTVGAKVGARGCVGVTAGQSGCVGFRDDAVKLLVIFTDEGNDGMEETVGQTAAALRDADVRVIGVWSGEPANSERNDLRNLVVQSQSFDAMGAPLIVNGRNSNIRTPLSSAINVAVYGIPLDVAVEATNTSSMQNAVQFIDRIVANPGATSPDGPCAALPTEDRDGDERGLQDTYPNVEPGAPVCFDVVPAQNDAVEPTREPQVFIARISVLGDGSPLDQRFVYFLIPPFIPDPGAPM